MLEYFDIDKQHLKVSGKANPVHWQPLSVGLYKANFNEAFFGNIGLAQIGVVVWDCDGSVIIALSQKIRIAHSMDAIEVVACSRAVSFAKELSLFDVTFERDSNRVV